MPTTDELWKHYSYHTPRAFWDASVWVGANYITGNIDPADQKRIWLDIHEFMEKSFEERVRAAQEAAWDEGWRRGFGLPGDAHVPPSLNPYRKKPNN